MLDKKNVIGNVQMRSVSFCAFTGRIQIL